MSGQGAVNEAAFLAALAGILGDDNVLAGEEATAAYLTDWRGRYRGRARCVLRPGTTAEVAAAVALCARAGVPMLAQGGNTGLVGGATPDASGEAVVISLARLDRIRAIDAANFAITAEAGCSLARVQEAAREAGRLFPLSLASEGSCQIGGNLSTNAGGIHVLRYGSMRSLALGLEVVLPDGTVWDGLRALRKDNTGYDLKQLFIGAEGTLGVITAAVLRLFPMPRARAVAWAAVRDPAAAVALLGRLLDRFAERLSAFEIIGASALELVLRHIPGSREPLAQVYAWQVLVEVTQSEPGGEPSSALETALAEALETGLVADAVIARSEAQAAALWKLRESIPEAERIEGVSIKHDISVPVSRIPDFLERAGRALGEAFADVRIVAFGHIGDGNLHYNLSRPQAAKDDEFISRTPDANRIVYDLVAELAGSISAEHGLGQLKREEIRRYRSAVELGLMRAIKVALDPRGLMNPGKLL
ncbi:MAG: FAD-binding oxidoreductase [Rhodocyclaceae bacterium]